MHEKAALHFARLLKHPDPPSATWDWLDEQPHEKWVAALELSPNATPDHVDGEIASRISLIERGLLE